MVDRKMNLGGQEVLVKADDIDDIVCDAFEGGINYWCDMAKPVGDYLGTWASEQISRGGKVLLHDFEDDEWRMLTLDGVLNGISKVVNEYGRQIVHNGEIDVYEIDGEIADMIIQIAVFDDVIYG